MYADLGQRIDDPVLIDRAEALVHKFLQVGIVRHMFTLAERQPRDKQLFSRPVYFGTLL
jgi:hypothetical protein